jgi:hypothetical protein
MDSPAEGGAGIAYEAARLTTSAAEDLQGCETLTFDGSFGGVVGG